MDLVTNYMNWKIALFSISFLLLLGGANFALAFGISPPWVHADRLIPGSHYEQIIYLTQAQPEQDLDIEVKMDPSEINDWFTFEPGENFTIPSGIQQFPMKVIVNVPKDAAYEVYSGRIRIRAISGGEGQVAVLVGAIADVRVQVSGEEYSDFKVRNIKVKHIEEGWPLKAYIKIENLGNVKIRPSRVHFTVYDQYETKVIKGGDAKNMNWIEPFETGEVIAEMAVDLELGDYWVETTILKDGKEVLKEKSYFSVQEKGSIKPYITFLGISIYIWSVILAAILFIIFGTKFGFWNKILNKFGVNIAIQKTK